MCISSLNFVIVYCNDQSGDGTDELPVSQEGVPPGYEAVSLIEALNGPCGLPPPNTMEGWILFASVFLSFVFSLV